MAPDSPTLLPQHLLNRELSWLEFNQRVLEEALDNRNPLLERLKFFCAFSSNLDEFFEVRVAGLKQQMESAVVPVSPDGLTATENMRLVQRRVRRLVQRQYACWRNEIRPLLAEQGIRFLLLSKLSPEDSRWVEKFYQTQVRPVLTPLALDPAHPFPQLLNKSLNLIVQLRPAGAKQGEARLAVVQAPRVLPRLVQLPRTAERQREYLFLADIIGHYLNDLFPGTKILGHWSFRVTRNTELYANEEEAASLLKTVEPELQNRSRGKAVRLEVERGCPVEIRGSLLQNLDLHAADLFVINGPLNPIRLMTVAEGDHSPELRYPPLVAAAPAALREEPDLFAAIRQGDILLHHPYEDFGSVLDFLRQAAADPDVLAIKMTLYRTGQDSEINSILREAAQSGKQVAVVVELHEPHQEALALDWPQLLEEAGVHVTYGLAGCKVHAKMCLVVRKDKDAIRRYLHVSTGNYNPVTARNYVDYGLMTCRAALGEDAASLFNLLTGVCQFQGTKKLLVAPFELHARMIKLIEREAAYAAKGLPARVVARMNSLSDPAIIAALYQASRAGVKIELIVRGVCCLRPGIKGLSERITVRSIVDRFVEHDRLFYFENACQPEIFLGSADWIPRSFFRRIEVVVAVEDGNLRERLRLSLFDNILKDNCKARFLTSSGAYTRPARRRGVAEYRSQMEFIKAAGEGTAEAVVQRHGRLKYPQFKLAPRPIAAKVS